MVPSLAGWRPAVRDPRLDVLIVLGGKQSAVNDTGYPYLPVLAGSVPRFGTAKAVLGVCGIP